MRIIKIGLTGMAVSMLLAYFVNTAYAAEGITTITVM